MRSVHERHRLALAALDAGAHLPVVSHAAQALGIVARHAPLTLRSALRPGAGPYAELVVALGPRPQDTVSVECWVSRPYGLDAPHLARAGAVGWVSVTPITDDPVAATAARLDGTETSLVRYHRGRRATVRVAGPTGLPACPVAYAKVYSDTRAAGRHELAERLAEAAATGRLGLRVPRPVRYDADRYVLWYDEVAGVPAADRLTGPAAPALATRMGAALGSLHTSGLEASRRLTLAGQVMRAERYAAEASRLVPALGERVMRLLDTVGTDPSGHGRTVTVHGSPDPSQWLVGEEPVPGLLDFDRFALGEPETDVACFLVEVDALGHGLFSAAVAEGFMAGYRSTGGTVDPESLRRHSTMRRIGKVLRAARALRVDGDRRAGRILAAAERAAARPTGVTTGVGR